MRGLGRDREPITYCGCEGWVSGHRAGSRAEIASCCTFDLSRLAGCRSDIYCPIIVIDTRLAGHGLLSYISTFNGVRSFRTFTWRREAASSVVVRHYGRLQPPLRQPCLLVPFLTYIFLFSNHMAPLVAAAPPTFLACRGNKSRKCYRKEFTRHGVTFLAMPCDHILSASTSCTLWRSFLRGLSQISLRPRITFGSAGKFPFSGWERTVLQTMSSRV